MSKTDKKVSKNGKVDKKNVKEQREYRNPADTKWGKGIIWVLIFGMGGLIIASGIAAIVQLF